MLLLPELKTERKNAHTEKERFSRDWFKSMWHAMKARKQRKTREI